MGKGEGDILTGDWNPIIGCERYSEGCRLCWYLDGIFPWQQRLGNIPAHVKPNEHCVYENRLTFAEIKKKKGIVGIVQHGDLFWDKVPDETIEKVLGLIDEAAAARKDQTRYVLWTKRAERMACLINRKYPSGLPAHLAVSVSVENQKRADERLPHLLSIKGTRIIMLEPMLGPVDLEKYLPVEWVVVGSETNKEGHATPLDREWVCTVRDQVKGLNIPFFIKQLGSRHDALDRELDGMKWSEFPAGFVKNPARPRSGN